MTEDAELLHRYADDASEEAFAELVRRHLGLVYACALRGVGGDAHLAEDVAQQVFAEVARRAKQLARRPVLAGWLFTSARFAASKAMRSARRRLQREQEVQFMEEISADPAAHLDWEKARPLLDDSIAALSEQDREAVLLRYFEGRDFASIGARLNLTDNAARMRVERALSKLRKRLSRRGVTSTAAALAAALAQQTAVALPAGLAANVTGAALAAGGGATGAAAALGSSGALLLMNKLQLGIAGALVLATGTGFVIQAHRISESRSEATALRQQNQGIAAAEADTKRLTAIVAEAAALRQDDQELARLRDEADALQATLAKTAQRATATTSVPRPALSERTGEGLRKIKLLQDAKDWPGIASLVDSLIAQADPTSYDMAFLLDLKAKVLLQQNRLREAIEPWEKALTLAEQFKYFDPKSRHDIDNFVAQLRFSAGLSTTPPPRTWF